MGVYHGGYVWLKDQAFNFHPLFMVLGMIFFYAEGDIFNFLRTKTDLPHLEHIHILVC